MDEVRVKKQILLFSLTSIILLKIGFCHSQPNPIPVPFPTLPFPLASITQPLAIPSLPSIPAAKLPTNPQTPNNDIIGYIVVPYPGIDQRNDMQSSIFSLLNGGLGGLGGLGRSYRRLRGAYPAPLMINPLNPMAYNAFPGYHTLYGYNGRMPLFNLFGMG